MTCRTLTTSYREPATSYHLEAGRPSGPKVLQSNKAPFPFKKEGFLPSDYNTTHTIGGFQNDPCNPC